ncbi:MAG TPA: hypothetical protein PKM62_07220 [Azospira sp.]|nr:hypothetical protein [Azospira sp.]
MSNDAQNDPLEFMKGMWGNMGFSLPGMVTPTFDVDELEKRIHDLKAVEGWLRMNLSMLQMTIQSLEMQRSTLTAVRAMGQMAAERSAAASEAGEVGAAPDGASPFAQAAMWPWNMMQQMQTQMAQQAQAEAPPSHPEPEATKAAAKKAKKQ